MQNSNRIQTMSYHPVVITYFYMEFAGKVKELFEKTSHCNIFTTMSESQNSRRMQPINYPTLLLL